MPVALQSIIVAALQFGGVIFCTVLVCSVGLPLALVVFPVHFVRYLLLIYDVHVCLHFVRTSGPVHASDVVIYATYMSVLESL